MILKEDEHDMLPLAEPHPLFLTKCPSKCSRFQEKAAPPSQFTTSSCGVRHLQAVSLLQLSIYMEGV